MAKFLSGPLVGEIRGSEGGTTFSRNRFGQYTRQRSIPVNPNTGPQTFLRELIGDLAARWRVLSDGERAAWNNLADEIVLTDNLGQPYNPTGPQVYNSVNVNRVYFLDEGVTDIAPALPSFTPFEIASFGVTADAGDDDVTAITALTTSPAAPAEDDTTRWVVRLSGVMSPGRAFVARQDFRLISREVSGTNFAANAAIAASTNLADYTTRWHELYGPSGFVGQRVHIEVSQMTQSGIISTPQRASTVLVAPPA